MNYVLARTHLEVLEGAGVLTHENFGKRIRYYGFKESTRAVAVKNFGSLALKRRYERP
jgi:hypothetical protein